MLKALKKNSLTFIIGLKKSLFYIYSKLNDMIIKTRISQICMIGRQGGMTEESLKTLMFGF
ncbi:hypothetical protein GCM10022397_38910 [Flavivirga jejuensis]